MLAKRNLFIVFLILVFFPLISTAAENELQVGKTQDGSLSSGKSDSYLLSLKPGDFVETNVVTHGTKLIITIYDPSANKARAFRLNGPARKIGFFADDPGAYRLNVALDENAKDGPYTLTLTRVIPLTNRTDIVPDAEKYESPRIKALRTALDLHQQGAAANFWEEVKSKRSPLIEPLQGDQKNMLVTFLYRGSENTKHVLLSWVPYSYLWPDEYSRMIRLADTDVWYKTLVVDSRERFLYELGPNAPFLFYSQQPYSDEFTSMLSAGWQVDSFNPKRLFVDANSPDVSVHNGVSVVEMPNAPPQPWVAKRKGVPEGSVVRQQFSSTLLKNEREVAVYTPPGYSKDSKPYGLVVIFDEKQYLDDNLIPTPTILDNLIVDKRIPPVVAILIDNAPGARNRELTCNPDFSDFLSSEILPWAHGLYNVTADPRQTVVGGSSDGGLAATCAGLRHPEAFGNVLSQSGAYWWTPPKSDNPLDFDPDAEPNYVAKQFIASPKLPLRFYMDAGSEELSVFGLIQGLLISNQYLRDVLLAKGYEVNYQEFIGGHDYLSWRGNLADGLIALLGSTTGSQRPRP